MLSLENFETQLSETIVKRGKEYYENGAVTSIEQAGKGYWEAEIQGSETYSVEIKITAANKISEYSCDCPFDGSICKHITAFLFAIREELEKPGTKSGKNIQKDVFGDLLKKLSLAELQEFTSQYAKRDKDFKTEFELWFADKDDRIDISKKYEGLIKKIIAKYSDRGFINYRSSIGLAREIDELIGSGHSFIKKGNYRDAFLFAKPLLKEMVEVVTYCDDSSGSIGGTINDAIRFIETITKAGEVAIELLEQVFDFLHTELKDKVYFSYGDFGYDLFYIFQSLAIQLNRSQDFLHFIDARSAELTGEYDGYRQEFFTKRKIEFLKAIGKTSEAEKLVEQNMDIVEIRLAQVNKAITKKDLLQAKKLIEGGIKIAEDKKHPGTVSQWEKELLRIAVIEKDTAKIRYYTKHFAFDRGFNNQYYKEWKKTYNTTEWKLVIEKYIHEQIAKITQEHKENKNKMWLPVNPPLLEKLAPIYIEEQYWDRLFELVKRESNIEAVLRYHDYLFKQYPIELLEIYVPMLEGSGDKANSRSDYAALAGYMQRLMKDIPQGKEKITALAKSLKQKYPRRPAMIDELNKIL